MNLQKYATGQLYSAGALNQEQTDRLSYDKEIISSFLVNDKCILGSGSLLGQLDGSQLSITPGSAFLKYLNDIKSVSVASSIIEPQTSLSSTNVTTAHTIKAGTTPKVYKSYALYDAVELENVGTGDGSDYKFPLRYISDGNKSNTSVFINSTQMSNSIWNFSDWPTGGSANKAIEFITSAAEVETSNSSISWDLDGKTLSFNLFNPTTLVTTRVDLTFSGNGKSIDDVKNEIIAAIDAAIPGSPYTCITVSGPKLRITSGLNTGFDMRIQILSCTAITNTGGGTYLGFDTDLHVGSGEVTDNDVVYVSYKKYFEDFAVSFTGNSITCNSLINSPSENPHVPVIIIYEPDLNLYYGTASNCVAALPSAGESRYDVFYIRNTQLKMFDITFFFDDATMIPYQKYAFSRLFDSFSIGVYSGTTGVSPSRVDMATFYAANPDAIPVFECLVSSSGPTSVNNKIVGDISGTVNVNYVRVSDYRMSLDTLEKLRTRKIEIPFKKGLSLSSGVSSIDLEIDTAAGYAVINEYVGIVSTGGEPVYRKADGSPASEAIENLIFAKISTVTPGSEAITLYRGDPEGSSSAFTTGQSESLVATYYLRTTLENIPSDVFKNIATSGMAVYDGGALTALRDHLNDTYSSLFNIDYGDISYTRADGKVRWSAMRFLFRDTNGSYFNTVTASTSGTALSPVENAYIYVLLDRDGSTVQDDLIKSSLDPWAANAGREYDVFVLGKMVNYGAGIQLQRARFGQLWNEIRRIYSNLNITQFGKTTFSSAAALLKWSALEFSFYNHIGATVKNTVTANGVGITLAEDEYAYVVLNRTGSTVIDDTIKHSTNPWSTEAIANGSNTDVDIIIIGQCKGSAAPYSFVQTLGGGGAGSSSFQIDITQANSFSAKDVIYFDGTSWEKAQADNADTLGTHIVLEDPAPSASGFSAASGGVVKFYNHGFPVGSYLYTSATVPGLLETSAPLESGFSNPLAQVIDADTFIIHDWQASGPINSYSQTRVSGDESQIESLMEAVIASKTTSVLPSYKNSIAEGFISALSGRVESSNLSITSSQALLDGSNLTGHIINRTYLVGSSLASPLSILLRQENSRILDVDDNSNDSEHTQLSPTTDYSSEYASGCYVWFIEMRRTDLGGSVYTEWKQGGNAYRALVSSCSATMRLTHSSIGVTLPAATSTLKYVCYYEHAKADYSIGAAGSAESFISLVPTMAIIDPDDSNKLFIYYGVGSLAYSSGYKLATKSYLVRTVSSQTPKLDSVAAMVLDNIFVENFSATVSSNLSASSNVETDSTGVIKTVGSYDAILRSQIFN